MVENLIVGVVQEEEEDNLEYDSDGNLIVFIKKIIDFFFFIDYLEIDYLLFEKNFYNEYEEIINFILQQLIDFWYKFNFWVFGVVFFRLGSSFVYFGFDE